MDQIRQGNVSDFAKASMSYVRYVKDRRLHEWKASKTTLMTPSEWFSFQVNLRKVDPDEVRESSAKSGADGGIGDVLQDALKTFRMDIAGSSSDEDDSDADSDDDEWD